MKMIFLGDSITDANHLFTEDNLGEGYVKNIASTFELLGNGDNSIINKGYDGFGISRVFRLAEEVAEANPDVVTILIGINDVAENIQGVGRLSREDFKNTYADILHILLNKTNCKIIIMEPFIFEKPEEFKLWKKPLKDYVEEINSLERIFEKYSGRIAYVDAFGRFEEMEKVYGSDYLTTDGIHLTPQGHKMLSDWWMEALANILVD